MSDAVYKGPKQESAASRVVKTLLENETIPAPTKHGRPVRIKTPKGEVRGDWTGYYDMRPYGGELKHSVGYPGAGGGWTHGILRPGDELLDPVPSHDEWQEEKRRAEAAKQAQSAQKI